MILSMDEKLKYRLIGLAVIVSIAAIFIPAMVKKSNQRIDRNMSMNIVLPARPHMPHVVIKAERDMLHKTQVAHVDLPQVSEETPLPHLAKADVIKPQELNIANLDQELDQTKTDLIKPLTRSSVPIPPVKPKLKLALNEPSKERNKIERVAPAPKQILQSASKESSKNKELYAVQLASFAKLSNATGLTKELLDKGYQVKMTKVDHKNGMLYKVRVGTIKDRQEAERLKNQLLAHFQLKGFVVNTGVS